ncbi:MAG: dipeptide ABC transporter ATP-binding protein, partial [Kiloniellales bacterium]|nr:dipeptide ABC transporter ATP-binding protein [Kiloniellales bacterium]
QRQRVMIAMALANEPDLLIADEPTTALDVTIQAQILDLLSALQARLGMAVAFITHDLAIVRRIARRVVVMHDGRIVERGPTARIFAAPREAYTRMLLAAEPRGRKPPVPADRPVLLEGRRLSVRFAARGGLFAGRRRLLTAVDGVSLRLRQGQTLGVVGESGSGKTTLGRALLRLLPSSGEIRYDGAEIQDLSLNKLRPLRKDFQIVFQDPYGSLSPRMTVGEIVAEGLLVHEPGLSARDRDRRCGAALAEVRLEPAMRNRYPHEFSGGQRQRIAIARALILKPRVIVLDEPTSALDRSVQKQIIELLRDLQAGHGLSYLFISHDLAVVRALADEVMVMQHGRCVEQGPSEAVFAAPREAYTRALLAAALDLDAAAPDHTV